MKTLDEKFLIEKNNKFVNDLIKFLLEISNNWPHDLYGTKVYKTLKSR